MNAQIRLIESPFTATDKRQKTKRKGRKRMAEREEKRHTGKNFLFMAFSMGYWRRKWQPTPVLLPREFRGQRSLVGCYLWGCTESDTTKAT